jgi:hypothetical protein
MRMLPMLAVAIVAGCLPDTSSETATPKPGPSITGTWSAMDANERVMVLQLQQTGLNVTGTGSIGSVSLTASGVNQYSACTCQCPCAAVAPVALVLADVIGDTMRVVGGPYAQVAVLDSLTVGATLSGPPPGFPFASYSFTLVKTPQ